MPYPTQNYKNSSSLFYHLLLTGAKQIVNTFRKALQHFYFIQKFKILWYIALIRFYVQCIYIAENSTFHHIISSRTVCMPENRTVLHSNI